MSANSPRIAPISLDQVPDADMAMFGGRENPRNQLNFFKVLIQNPVLLKKYEPLAMQLGREPSIPSRDKEILILRTSILCGETYELAHHLFIARQAGMSDEEIEAAKNGGAGLSPFEQALARAAEELVRSHCISDDTWAVLAARYTNSQLIEVVFMVANYTLLAMVNNSLGIYPEDQVEHAWKPTDAN
jgi:4-carboxymuconolactone decarboxylase